MRATKNSPNGVIACAPWNGFRLALAASLPGSACHTFARALGPCTAIIARSSRGVSVSCGARSAISLRSHATSLSVVPALTTMRNQSSREEVDDEVVEDAAVRAQQARIERLAGVLELVDVVGERIAQEIARAVAAQIERAHVRYVEHAGVAAHGVMLVDLRAVVDRHVPAAEVDHARARGAMHGMERGVL